MSRAIALAFAFAVVAAGVLVAGSSGARQTQRTIGLVLPDPNGGAPLSRELPLGQPLTITKANLGKYVGK